MKTEDWLMFLKTDGSNMIVYNGFYISRYPYAPISRLTPQRQRILLNSSQHQHTYAFRPVPYAPPPQHSQHSYYAVRCSKNFLIRLKLSHKHPEADFSTVFPLSRSLPLSLSLSLSLLSKSNNANNSLH